MTAISQPVRRPTRDEALDNAGKVAARIWLGLSDKERAEIRAEAEAARPSRQAS